MHIQGKSIFEFFWIFNFLQFAIDGQNNSKTKVEKVFFFIFMSSYAEMSFWNCNSKIDFPNVHFTLSWL
jgi:hypothetical protein